MAPTEHGVPVQNVIRSRRDASQNPTSKDDHEGTGQESVARKKQRLENDPYVQLRSQIDTLSAHPERKIKLPDSRLPSERLPPPPEFVMNMQGSSAGAGSGEFHVYKQARQRELQRQEAFEEERRREKELAEFERKKQEWKTKDEVRTEKRRRERERRKRKRNGGSNAKDDKPKSLKNDSDNNYNDNNEQKASHTNPEHGIEHMESSNQSTDITSEPEKADGEINLTIIDDLDL
ncbi:hypothetical protein V1511DRAFT_376881 [Dipodascopsis uninucleata]